MSAHTKGWRSTSDEAWERAPICIECHMDWPCEVATLDAEIDALRARVVVAEEGADRLAAILGGYVSGIACQTDHNGFCQEHGSGGTAEFPNCINVDAHAELAAHQRAVSSRPKATQSAPNGEPT